MGMKVNRMFSIVVLVQCLTVRTIFIGIAFGDLTSLIGDVILYFLTVLGRYGLDVARDSHFSGLVH